MVRWGAVVACAVLLALAWRPLAAWWCDDRGNIALARGEPREASAWFAKGLALEPQWTLLLEDHARTILPTNPNAALVELRAADCGAECLAQEGDAEIQLGHPRQAVDDYLAADAASRVERTSDLLARNGRFDDAIVLEQALIARLGSGMLAQADVASAYFSIGNLDVAAAHRAPTSGARDSPARYRAGAIQSYRAASALAPFNEGYLLSLGFAQAQWGDRARARAAFERVLSLHPHQSDAERGLSGLAARGAAGP